MSEQWQLRFLDHLRDEEIALARQLEHQAAPFVAGSQTSFEASEAIKPSRAKMRERVFAYIREHPGCTDEEIANRLGMNPSTARPRRLELARAGRIEASGKALTSTGRRATCWTVAPAPHS